MTLKQRTFKNRLHIKLLDILIFLLFLSIAVYSLLSLGNKNTQAARLIIDTPDGQYMYDMSVDRDLEIKGAIGNSNIAIKDKRAYFKDSPCPGKTCVQCAPIRRNMEWIACLPNQIFIHVEGSTSESVKQETDVFSF